MSSGAARNSLVKSGAARNSRFFDGTMQYRTAPPARCDLETSDRPDLMQPGSMRPRPSGRCILWLHGAGLLCARHTRAHPLSKNTRERGTTHDRDALTTNLLPCSSQHPKLRQRYCTGPKSRCQHPCKGVLPPYTRPARKTRLTVNGSVPRSVSVCYRHLSR